MLSMPHRTKRLLVAASLLASTVVPAGAVTCPAAPETRVGQVESLPVDGWFIYHKANDGIYKAGLKTWKAGAKKLDPVAKITEMDISPDGKWILFSTGATCYVMKSDGTSKTTVPATISTGYNQGNAVFVRNGPYGDEIAYNKDKGLEVIRIDLSGSLPTFGSKRLIAKDIAGKDPQGQTSTFTGTIRVNGNHIFARVGYTGRHITIPDSGKGIATNSTMHPVWERYGCGLAVSPDGKLVLTNSAGTMDECGPAQHKGFIVGKFLEYNQYLDTKTGINWVVNHSTSINWCPEQYRGNPITPYRDLEFQSWNWSNHADYVIGEQHGNVSTVKDVWVVNRTTNIWTRVTFGNTPLNTPVLWIENAATSVGPRSAHVKNRTASADRQRRFTIGGRRIGAAPSRHVGVEIVPTASRTATIRLLGM